MKLKLFKKYFFTTAIIIVFSLSVMLMILSFVLNNNIAASKQVVLTKACSEVVEYIGQVSEENEAADVISGFLRPNVGVAAAMAELAAGTAPNAGVFPNTGVLPEEAVANPELGLKLKF